jgi:hypothetical protein
LPTGAGTFPAAWAIPAGNTSVTPGQCSSTIAGGVGPPGQTTSQVCQGSGLTFIGPAVGQVASVIGPTTIGPAFIGTSIVSAGTVAVGV